LLTAIRNSFDRLQTMGVQFDELLDALTDTDYNVQVCSEYAD
jgi:hypothetical protein